MGAINFSGGSWCGVGSGKVFDRNFFCGSEFCLTCGELEEDCECSYFNDYDTQYESDLFDKYKEELSDIEDKIIAMLKSKNTENDTKVATILEGIREYEGENFIKIKEGYYNGFQIYCDKNDIEHSNYNYDEEEGEYIYLKDYDTINLIVDYVNATLNEIEWEYRI